MRNNITTKRNIQIRCCDRKRNGNIDLGWFIPRRMAHIGTPMINCIIRRCDAMEVDIKSFITPVWPDGRFCHKVDIEVYYLYDLCLQLLYHDQAQK